jgi:hypothetical protein
MQALQEAGMPEAAVARRLGLPYGAFTNLMRGSNGLPPGQKIRSETAEAVLGYWPVLADFPDSASIDPTGTRRRVEALATRGWSKARLAPEIGTSYVGLKNRLRAERVSGRFARAMAEVYDRLWNQRPEDHGVQGWVADRVRRNAQRDGWAGPLAWDDDTIDDPKAQPQTDSVEPIASEGKNVAGRWLHGESVILGPDDRKQVVQYLFEWTNDTAEEIAAQLEMTVDAVWQTWSRIKKKAREEGRTEPWRRVYVPRERSLNQDEMEEVA